MIIFKICSFLWFFGASVLASPRRIYKQGNKAVGVNNGVVSGLYGDQRTKSNNDTLLCYGDSGDMGVCMYRDLCLAREGMELGTCGTSGTLNLYDGNVCCKFEASCNSIVSESVAYFQSPDYPEYMNDEVSCNLQLNILRKVTQIRIDFLEFELPAPGQDGRCHASNYFNVFSSQSPLGVLGGTQAQALCGINTGNHIYLPVVEGEKIQLMFTVNGLLPVPLSQATHSLSSDLAFRWNIRVLQIEEDSSDEIASKLSAPPGCTQYFTESYGQINSFNYDATARFGPNQDYSICFDDKDGNKQKTCKVTLRSIRFGLPTELGNSVQTYGGDSYSSGGDYYNPLDRPYSSGGDSYNPPDGPYPPGQAPPSGPYPSGPYPPGYTPPPSGPYPPGQTPESSNSLFRKCSDGIYFASDFKECCTDSDSSYIGLVQNVPLRYFFCGKKFSNSNGLMDVTAKPFEMRVYSPNWDTSTVLDQDYVGFSFDYQLISGLC